MRRFSITTLLIAALFAPVLTASTLAADGSCLLFPGLFRPFSRAESRPAAPLTTAPLYSPAPAATANYPVVSTPMVVERPVYTTYSPVIVEYPLSAQSAPPVYEAVRSYDQPVFSTSGRVVTTVCEVPAMETQIVERHILPPNTTTQRRTFVETPSVESSAPVGGIVRVDEMFPLKAAEESKPDLVTAEENRTSDRPTGFPTILETSDAEETIAAIAPKRPPLPMWPEFPVDKSDSPIVLNRPTSRTREQEDERTFGRGFLPKSLENSRDGEDTSVIRGQVGGITERLDQAIALPPPAGRRPDPSDIPEVLTKTEEPTLLPEDPRDITTTDPVTDPNSAGGGPGTASVKPAPPNLDGATANGFLMIAAIVSTVGCVFFVILAFDYYHRWMQSLTVQNDRFALGVGEDGGSLGLSSDMEYYPSGGGYMDDLAASRYNGDFYDSPPPRY